MPRITLTTAATLAVFGALLLVPLPAPAATVAAPAELAATLNTVNPLQDVAYVCRRVWRCGRYGCGWRRVCRWTHRRPYWRHRYWRRYHRGYWW